MDKAKILKLFGPFLRDIRKNRNLSQEELAAKSQLDRTYISMLERGIKNPTLVTIFQLCEALRISPDRLVSLVMGKGLIVQKKKNQQKDISLPLMGTPVSCGKAFGIEQIVDEVLSLDDLLVKNAKDTFFVRASGQSMQPVIHDGDYLVIDRVQKAKPGTVVLAQIDNEFTIKRFSQDPLSGVNQLIPDNPLFKTIDISSESSVLICGIVTAVIKLNP